VVVSTPFAVIGILVLSVLRWMIFVLSIGDEEAKSLGVNAEKERLTL